MENPLATKLARLLQLGGVSTNVPASTLAATIEANAAQYASGVLPTNMLFPALIWAMNQTLAKLPSATTGYVYAGNYNGVAPVGIPPAGVTGAIATDSVTGRQWVFASGIWE